MPHKLKMYDSNDITSFLQLFDVCNSSHPLTYPIYDPRIKTQEKDSMEVETPEIKNIPFVDPQTGVFFSILIPLLRLSLIMINFSLYNYRHYFQLLMMTK